MRRRLVNPWFGIGLDAWRLGLEASAVIGLRTLKIARGGASGQAEAKRMVNEKVEAAADLQARALTGGLGTTPVSASARTIAHLSPQDQRQPPTADERLEWAAGRKDRPPGRGPPVRSCIQNPPIRVESCLMFSGSFRPVRATPA